MFEENTKLACITKYKNYGVENCIWYVKLEIGIAESYRVRAFLSYIA